LTLKDNPGAARAARSYVHVIRTTPGWLGRACETVPHLASPLAGGRRLLDDDDTPLVTRIHCVQEPDRFVLKDGFVQMRICGDPTRRRVLSVDA
jgi:hypothetical protein